MEEWQVFSDGALVAEGDGAAYAQMRDCLMRYGIQVDRAHSAREVMDNLSNRRYALLTLSLTLPGADGLSVIDGIKRLRMPRMPAVLVTHVRGMEGYAGPALARGAFAALPKDKIPGSLPAALDGLTPYSALCPAFASAERIGRLLTSLNIAAHLKGYRYMSDAISLAARDDGLLGRLSGALYPAVAKAHGDIKGSLVERSIRNAIESAWTHGRLETLYGFFGDIIDAGRGKPTNGEFILRAVEALRMGE